MQRVHDRDLRLLANPKDGCGDRWEPIVNMNNVWSKLCEHLRHLTLHGRRENQAGSLKPVFWHVCHGLHRCPHRIAERRFHGAQASQLRHRRQNPLRRAVDIDCEPLRLSFFPLKHRVGSAADVSFLTKQFRCLYSAGPCWIRPRKRLGTLLPTSNPLCRVHQCVKKDCDIHQHSSVLNVVKVVLNRLMNCKLTIST